MNSSRSISLMCAVMGLMSATASAQDAPLDTSFGAIQSVFQTYCVVPFPDAAAFQNAINDDANGFGIIEKTEAQQRQPGERWTNGFITLSYIDADWMPRDIPSPQCHVTALLDEPLDHLNTAQRLSVDLKLGKGRSSGRANINKTVWNIDLPTGETARVFFDSRPASNGGFEISLNMLRLRKHDNDD